MTIPPSLPYDVALPHLADNRTPSIGTRLNETIAEGDRAWRGEADGSKTTS